MKEKDAFLDGVLKPESFKSFGFKRIDLLADYLRKVEESPDTFPVLKGRDRQEMFDEWVPPPPGGYGEENMPE